MAKKDFSDRQNPVLNPALRYISSAQPVEEPPVAEAPRPAPVKASKAPEAATEKKSRRLNLLLQPSVLKDIGRIATMRQTSVNDLINTVLRAYVEEEAETIRRYGEIFEK